MTQLNTPYPATAYLTGFLRQHEARLGVEVRQADPAILLFLRLFSRAGLARVLAALVRRRRAPSVASFAARADVYVDTVDAAVRFLQGRDPGLALRIVGRAFLPEGPRFAPISEAAAGLGEDRKSTRLNSSH